MSRPPARAAALCAASTSRSGAPPCSATMLSCDALTAGSKSLSVVAGATLSECRRRHCLEAATESRSQRRLSALCSARRCLDAAERSVSSGMKEATPSSAHFSTAQSARCDRPLQAMATVQRGPTQGADTGAAHGSTSATPRALTATMRAATHAPSPSNSSTTSPGSRRSTRVAWRLSSTLSASRPAGSGEANSRGRLHVTRPRGRAATHTRIGGWRRRAGCDSANARSASVASGRSRWSVSRSLALKRARWLRPRAFVPLGQALAPPRRPCRPRARGALGR
jgi:hypothetical protein